MKLTIRCTTHALCRQAQRNLSNEDIEFILKYGRRVHRTGVLHIFLGWRDIPTDKTIYQHFGHLEGTVLVVDAAYSKPVLITAYRTNRERGLKQIRVKAKYNRGRRFSKNPS